MMNRDPQRALMTCLHCRHMGLMNNTHTCSLLNSRVLDLINRGNKFCPIGRNALYKPRLPNIMRRMRRLWNGAIKRAHVSLGLCRTDRAREIERLATCKTCEYNISRACKLCGCPIKSKVRLAVESCPMNYWSAQIKPCRSLKLFTFRGVSRCCSSFKTPRVASQGNTSRLISTALDPTLV